jgi:hypothetical protein
MSTQYVTNPQPSGSPLNLLYKGVFSTRLSVKNKSQYGHYLDKLYQVQFLGIGTHKGEVFHDIIDAVVLKHKSIGGQVELFRATRDKYNESIVLEALGGAPRELQTELYKELLAVPKKGTLADMLGLTDANKSSIKTDVDIVDAHGNVLRSVEVLSLDSFLKLGKEGKEGREFGIADKVKVAMSARLLETVVAESPVSDNAMILTDMDSVGRLLRKADVAAEAAYMAERFAKQMLEETLPVAGLSSREVSLAHYILYTENPEYKKIIDSALLRYVNASEVGNQFVTDTVYSLGKELVNKFKVDDTYQAAERFADEVALALNDFQFVGRVKEAVEHLTSSLDVGSKSVNHARIDFDHELRAEDSKGLEAFLNLLYEDFKAFHQKGDVLEPSSFGGVPIGKDALIVEHLLGDDALHNRTGELADYYLGSPGTASAVELNYDKHAEMWSDIPVFAGDSRDEELFGELANISTTLAPDFGEDVLGELANTSSNLVPYLVDELVAAELTSEDSALFYDAEEPIFGELTSVPNVLTPEREPELWGELTSEESQFSVTVEQEVLGDLVNEATEFKPEIYFETFGTLIPTDEGIVQREYEIAVLGCANPNLKYRRRPPLEPDKKPEDPLFEWVCTEGYVCDDWLIVPLKDFNFENADQDGFFDPVTLEPYFPTGQTDNDGDPYVLPPYSILNEPISNGVDVGGKEPMAIDPCNLYSFIQYVVKIYDAYKTRFQASNPIDTVSRVLNMLFEQVQKLIAEWDETKGYTPDELWRIYRFIRWMALGITNRFYRVKIEYTYGDFAERFEVYPFTDMITTEGASRKLVAPYGWVMEGHPLLDTLQNKVMFQFKLPQKTKSSTISFEMGNVVPDRPDEQQTGGVLFQENFEGLSTNFKLNGSGWVPVPTQSGTGLGIEDPAQARTYKTSSFNVPVNAVNALVKFNYGIDTNMDTRLTLKRSNGAVVWQSSGVVPYGYAQINPIAAGDYYFEVAVPQAESSQLREIVFDAQKIQDEWKKVGYITEWKVVGDTIYEEENTMGYAMVVNEQWLQDNDYEFEFEFYTKEDPSLYWAYDWLGGVFNYKDPNNYYRIGTWSDLDKYNSGIEKIVNGGVVQQWKFNELFLWKFNTWHKMKIKVQGNHFQVWIDGKQYFDIVDNAGWGYGASGLAAFSNPFSTFRRAKYRGKPRFHAFIDNVIVEADSIVVPVSKPKYAIDFYLDNDTTPRISDYSDESKRAYSFPIMEGEHKAKWVFKKIGDARSIAADASFIDNIVVTGMKAVDAKVVEEFIGCGGHLAVKLLIENLLEYYRRHHQGCKGERNIWIIE